MLKKNKKYTYEKLKKMFDVIKADVVRNPFGSTKEKAEQELNIESQFVISLMAIPIIHTIEEKLFGEEDSK